MMLIKDTMIGHQMQRFFQWILSKMGWRINGNLPDIAQYVLIVAPHTSNWDLIIGLIARFAVNTRILFLVKKEAYVFPLKYLLGPLGAIPVDRGKNLHVVDKITQQFKENERFILGLAPEGTRSTVTRWKFGFYHIAHQAKVPIVMVGMDYHRKEIRIAKPIKTSGDIEQDYQILMRFFKSIRGKHKKKLADYSSS